MDGLVCLAVLGVLLLLLLILDATGRRTGLPGPKGLPIIGVGFALAFKPLTEFYPWLQELVEKYGPLLEMNLGSIRSVTIADPVEAERLLSSQEYLSKGYAYFIFKPWLREGLLLSDGSKWHERRKLLTPTFHFKILEDSVSGMANNADRFVQRLLQMKGEPTVIENVIKRSTLDVMCETALGVDMAVSDKNKRDYVLAIKRITKNSTKRFLSFWLHNDWMFRLSSTGQEYFKDLATIHNFSQRVIQERKKEYSAFREVKEETGEKKRFAFLDRLLELDAQKPGQLSLVDIQEEVDTFTFEGHDTTATALGFCLFLLANHKDIQERAAEEQFAIFGSDKRQPEMKDLKEMTYLEMVIKETLRLYPSVPQISRTLHKDYVLTNGKIIPKGYVVAIPVWLIHRSKEHWDSPEEFRPERFSSGETRHPFSYIPFSAGPRNCIGQRFAMMEMKLFLSGVLRKCKLEPVTKSLTLILDVILSVDSPIVIKVLPRTH